MSSTGTVLPKEEPDAGESSQETQGMMPNKGRYRQMYYDYITQLPNMGYFFELAEAGRKKMGEQGIDSATLFFNLTGLKRFNRLYGFEEGNHLIRSVASILARHFGEYGCARLAQDHFAAYAPEEGLKDTLEAVMADCAQANDGKTLPIRIGVYPDRIEPVEIGMACDRAMLAANIQKKFDVSYYSFFDMEMMEEEKNKQEIIDNLDRAIEEGWIYVNYQPIVRSTNGKVCDVEALARWHDPSRGVLMPGAFIPVLEEAKLIPKLDLCVVRRVLQDMKHNEEIGNRNVPVSINFSRADFEAYDLVNEICTLVDAAQISRKLIVIEVTESMVGSDFEYMREQIERFRAQGFKVWMDDFGSGYSSLDALQRIKFDLIKFDMGFMRRLDEGDEGKIILTQLMKMATSLGVDTLCEGVETEEQVRFLREIGCSKLQGYYYSKPVPPDVILQKYTVDIVNGFENPRASAYYDTMGRVNLYDLSFLANKDNRVIQNTFDTVPMGVMEVDAEWKNAQFIRSNQAFREFMERAFGFDLSNPDIEYPIPTEGPGSIFMNAIRECGGSGNRTFVDEKVEDGSSVRSFVRVIGTNPLNGKESVAVAVLSITEPNDDATFAEIASALAADYYNIYVIDLEKDDYVEYTSQVGGEEMTPKRHGKCFFESAKRETTTRIYEADQEEFLEQFTKERVLHDIETRGFFVTTYRLVDSGKPMHVMMKITRMKGSKRLILGVSNIDAYKKREEEGEKLRQESVSLGRVAALSPDYIVLYTVDVETGHYMQFNPSNEFETFGLATQGEDFFGDVKRDAALAIASEDMERHLRVMTKENMLQTMKEEGFFIHRYRLVLGEENVPVTLKATLVQEDGKEIVLLGVSKD